MIGLLADLFVLLVALEHVGFMVLEMFLWDKPVGLQIFEHSEEQAAATRILAANQGLYNGFLAAGLFWGLAPSVFANDIRTFFLCCIIIAGAYGAFSLKQTMVAYVQSAPAAFTLLLVLLS
jgi:putative membrane protein